MEKYVWNCSRKKQDKNCFWTFQMVLNSTFTRVCTLCTFKNGSKKGRKNFFIFFTRVRSSDERHRTDECRFELIQVYECERTRLKKLHFRSLMKYHRISSHTQCALVSLTTSVVSHSVDKNLLYSRGSTTSDDYNSHWSWNNEFKWEIQFSSSSSLLSRFANEFDKISHLNIA